MGDKSAPSGSERQRCYAARDAFFQCMAQHGESEQACEDVKKAYHSNCLPSWVKYFDKKKVYEDYKKKLEEQGYQPVNFEYNPKTKS